MPDVVTPGNIILGRGEVYLDRLDAITGAKTGERFLGNVSKFAITPNDETIELNSSAEATSPLIAEDVVRRNFNIAMTLQEFSRENLALALMGTEQSFIQSSSSAVVDEAINNVQQGRWYQVGVGVATKRAITGVVVTGPGGTPTYVLDVGYKLDAVRGRIYIIDGGTIASGTNILVDYTPGSVTATPQIYAGQSSFIQAFLRFIGKPARGPIYEIEVWKASVRPDGELGFIADTYGEFGLSGKVLADSAGHPTNPYFNVLKIG